MDRRTRAFIVVGVAMALASLAAFGVYRAIQTRPVVRVPIAERYTVVATQPVSVGVILTKEMVRPAAWPADAPVTDGFEKVEDVIGRGVTTAMVTNEPVTNNKLAPKGSGGGLPPTITPGMRAIAVKVNDVVGVGGFLNVGARVDVIVTMRPAQEAVTRTVLSNVQVLSAGPNLDVQKGKEGLAVPQNVVTLLLTPADAERLSLATNQGQIMLAMRNPLDTEKTETTGVRTSSLLGALNPEPVKTVVRGQTRVVAPPPPPPPPKPYTVEVLAGPNRKTEVLKKTGGGGL
jgi:pilus assembly protein CpaB